MHENECSRFEKKGSLPVSRLQAHSAKIYGIDWSHNRRNELVTCSLDKTIKVWDIQRPHHQDGKHQPTITINTAYPVWRARDLPFGHGVLSLPQRGETALEMYAADKPTAPVERFEGHLDVVKEFVWRRGGACAFESPARLSVDTRCRNSLTIPTHHLVERQDATILAHRRRSHGGATFVIMSYLVSHSSFLSTESRNSICTRDACGSARSQPFRRADLFQQSADRVRPSTRALRANRAPCNPCRGARVSTTSPAEAQRTTLSHALVIQSSGYGCSVPI